MPGSSPGMTTRRQFCASPRNDWRRESSRSPHPIAMKAVGHAMGEMHERDGAGFDIGAVEHREVAAVFTCAIDHGEQPAVAFGGVLAALDKDRLGDRVALRQVKFAEPFSRSIHMRDA